MRRLGGVLGLAIAAAAVLFVFAVKQDVRQMENDLETARRDIGALEEAIRVLETEWSYLNQPARIAELASQHLSLRPLSGAQIVQLEDLPFRAAPETAAPGKAETVR